MQPEAFALAAHEAVGSYEQYIGDDAPTHDPFADYPGYTLSEAVPGYPYPLVAPRTVTATLAHNMAVRRQRIWDCWGTGVEIGWIGNAAHAAGCSDHNKDSAGVVHAIDPMVTGARAQAIVTGSLATPDDLQYVIHNRVIWSATVGWAPRNYTGPDPHETHVHVSGKHGSSHRSSATCVGYSLTAQAATPAFNPCATGGDDMTSDEMKTLANLIGDAVVTKLVTKDLGRAGGGDTIGVVLQTGVLQNSNKILAALQEISAKLTPPAA